MRLDDLLAQAPRIRDDCDGTTPPAIVAAFGSVARDQAGADS